MSSGNLALQRRADASAILSKLPKPNCVRMKIISMGAEGCGKSCIIKRYCEERFVSKYITTIGIDYGVKRVMMDGADVRVNFWDLAGGQEYFEVRNEFYKDAQGAILVYDVTNMRSFQQLDSWLTECTKYGVKDLVVAVCANKVDSPKRVVSESDGRRWATARGYAYWEISAQTGQNIQPMFDQLFRDTAMTRSLL